MTNSARGSSPPEPDIRLGTCSWSAQSWVGPVYAAGTKSTDFITEYAQRFDTVEIDATFYRVPSRATVEAWRRKTPDGFLFSAKAPKTITHDKFLVDCQGDLEVFLSTMSLLEDKLGPLLFQFPYFAKRKGVTPQDFLDRLAPFLAALPQEGFRFAVEVRNKAWLGAPLFDLLRERGVALALIDHPWMPRPAALPGASELLTGPFAYVRWLGDRYAIEKLTTTWDAPILDRRADLQAWAPLLRSILDQPTPVVGYVNNHYSGHAPHDVRTLSQLLGLSSAECP